jgi:SAM-dependent methyltransferase
MPKPNMAEIPVRSPIVFQALTAAAAPAFALLAGMQLELFTGLADGPLTSADIAGRLGVAVEPVLRLLYALVVAGLLEHDDGRFANTEETAEFLVKGRPRYLGGMHELLDEIWHADLLTAQSIRRAAPQALHDYANATDAEMTSFLRGLQGSALAAGRELAERFDFSHCRTVIDIGGGPGGLIAALCERYQNLRGTLFDLPRTAALAAALLAAGPAADRLDIQPGDILEALPRGQYDAAVLRAVVQVFGAEEAATAIANAAAVLRPGGRLYVLGGGILDDNRLGPRNAVFLNLTFLNVYRAGAAYTEAEHFAWLLAAGCVDPRRDALAGGAAVIWATKGG